MIYLYTALRRARERRRLDMEQEKISIMDNISMINENEKEVESLVGAEPMALARAIEEILDNKKGMNIKLLYTDDLTGIADYFVVCTATSNTHVKALAGEVEYQLERRGVHTYHMDGRDNGSWVVLDYSSVIVHIFNREAREFYNLEKLYDHAPIAQTEE